MRDFRSTGSHLRRFLIQALLTLSASPLIAGARAQPDFGPNVLIFNPSLPAAAIQKQIDAVYAIQRRNEFGRSRPP